MDRSVMIATLAPNPALDCSSEAEKVEPVHKIRTYNEVYAAGGGGINVARAMVQLGGEATAIYLSGGATGVYLGELVEAAGVKRCSIPIVANTRICHNVFERVGKTDYRFVPEGPLVSVNECRCLLDAVAASPANVIVASGSLPRGAPDDFYASAAEIAKSRGAAFHLDSSGTALRAALVRGGITVVKPSLGELSSIAGEKLTSRSAQETAAMRIVAAGGAKLVAVTLGQDGGFLASNEGVFHAPAPRITALSAVGAGDSFLAAMVLQLSRGQAPRDAFLYAMAAGAAACLNIGTRLCKLEDVERIHAEMVGEVRG
jgi:6-phosphofructokinase 2